MEIVKQIVPASHRAKRSYGGTNKRQYITIHETGNTSRGANAQAHANLQSRGNPGRAAAWHWQVDDKKAIQSYPHTAQCWHAGDGRRDGNLNSIAIEICVNKDGNFQQAVANAAELTRKIMAEENIPVSRVVQHNKWSGKNCPQRLRKGSHGVKWSQFVAMLSGGTVEPKPEPKPPSKPKTNKFGRPLLALTGTLDTATIREWQYQMGTTPDGVISKGRSQLVVAVQRYLNARKVRRPDGKALKVDGRGIGSNKSRRYPLVGRTNTIWALQSYLGTVKDGFLSRKKSSAVIALQKRLNNGDFKK